MEGKALNLELRFRASFACLHLSFGKLVRHVYHFNRYPDAYTAYLQCIDKIFLHEARAEVDIQKVVDISAICHDRPSFNM